jgi:hypothetical protein
VTEKTDLVGFKIKMIDKKVNWLNLRYLLKDLTREVDYFLTVKSSMMFTNFYLQ